MLICFVIVSAICHLLVRSLFICHFVLSCVRSFERSCVRSVRWFVRACVRVSCFMRSCVRSFVCSWVRSCVRSCVRAWVRWFVRTFVRSFVGSFVHSCVRSSFFCLSTWYLVTSLSFFCSFPFRSPALTFVVLLRSQREIVVTVFQRPIEMIMKGILLLISQISTSGPRALWWLVVTNLIACLYFWEK